MPENLLPALLIGSIPFVVGLLLLRSASREGQAHQMPIGTPAALVRQRWRRQQIAGILMLLGVSLPVGVAAPALEKGLPAVCYWAGVLLLTGWVVLLGLGDFAVSALRTRQHLRQLQAKQAALRDELQRRNQPASASTQRQVTNGHVTNGQSESDR